MSGIKGVSHPFPLIARALVVMAFVLAFLAWVTAGSVTNAANPGSGSVDTSTTTFNWTGQNYTLGATAGAPCPSATADPTNAVCDHLALTVNIPSSYWNTHTGGVQVAISWADTTDDFDLHIQDKDGNDVVDSTSANTNSETVLIVNANSDASPYQILVAPYTVTSSGYNGTATVQTSTSITPTPTPLPNLPGLDFSIDATPTNGTVHAGETYLDVIKVKNSSSSTATSVVVSGVIASGNVYLGGSTIPAANSGNGTSGNPLIWNLGSINAGAEQRIYLYLRAKNEGEDNTIVWQLLDTKVSLSYTLDSAGRSAKDQTLGPKVVPQGDVGNSVRHGKRPFPVAFVDYTDQKHTEPDSTFRGYFDSLIRRYTEMSMGQLLPVPVLPSIDRGTVTFASTPSETYRFSVLQPSGFCSGATLAEDGNAYDDNAPPAALTNRINDGWYQLPGTQGYYGSDSTASAYPGFLSGQAALINIDNGCGPVGKLVYDAATEMDPDVDFNDFDSNRDGWVDFFELVYQGQPENIIGETGVNNVWPHSSNLAYYYTDGYTTHDRLRDHQDRPLFWTDDTHSATTLTNTGKPAYVRVGAYNVNAEFSDAITFAHEYGHSLGLPDNYSTGSRNTMDDWDLMASGPGHMSMWDKQELGWIVPIELTSGQTLTGQHELKHDTNQVKWKDSGGNPYTLTGNVHNAEVYKVNLPKTQLFDPAIIPSGSWVYYSQSGNDFGYPGHLLDISFDANQTAGASNLKLQFKSWFEIEKDYDYGYLQVCQYRGNPSTLQCDNLPSINDAGEGGPTTSSTNPNGNNHGNGITCVSGSNSNPTCGVVSYPEPVFITDEFDLSAYAGQDFIVRWDYSTDPGAAYRGWVIDDIELLKNGTRVFFDDAEDPQKSNDGTHAYNGWIRSNGSSSQEHAYWIGLRDKTGFDATAGWTPGVVIEYANEAHGYGNSGVDDPPALTVIDSHPQKGNDSPTTNDAAWRPFPSSPGNTAASNGDVFTDCDDPAFADGPRHIDNYADPSQGDGDWHFGYRMMKLLVNSLASQGTFGAMTANVTYAVPAPCSNATTTPTQTATPKPSSTPSGTPATNTPTPTPTLSGDTTTVEDNTTLVQYNGWHGVQDANASGGSYRVSSAAGDSVIFRTTGATFQWVTYRGLDQGIAQVNIDGKSAKTVDLYSATPQYQFVRTFKKLSSGGHVIVIRVTNKKNQNSSGNNVVLDALHIGNATHEDEEVMFKYSSWKGKSNGSASGGTYRRSSSKSAVAALTFTGDSISWLTTKGPNMGRARVMIDNQDKGKFNLYASQAQFQVAISFDSLGAGQHTIAVHPLHKKGKKSKGYAVVVDAFRGPITAVAASDGGATDNPPAPDGQATGIVSSVDTAQGTVTIQPDDGGAPLTLRLNADSAVELNDEESDLTALRQGMVADVSYDTASGTIVDLDVSDPAAGP